MATKHTDTCLAKAKDDEPIFVLRAQDALAPTLVRVWAELAELHGAAQDKIDEARELANAMEQWEPRK